MNLALGRLLLEDGHQFDSMVDSIDQWWMSPVVYLDKITRLGLGLNLRPHKRTAISQPLFYFAEPLIFHLLMTYNSFITVTIFALLKLTITSVTINCTNTSTQFGYLLSKHLKCPYLLHLHEFVGQNNYFFPKQNKIQTKYQASSRG